MVKRLVGWFVRTHWRTFAGAGHDELVSYITEVLTALDRSFTCQSIPPTGAERTVFGADRSTRVRVGAHGFQVTVTSVGHDVIAGAALRFIRGGAATERVRDRTAIIDIQEISDRNRDAISQLLVGVARRMDRAPWQIDHPRFRLAPLLRYKVRLLWSFWLSEPGSSRPSADSSPEAAPASRRDPSAL